LTEILEVLTVDITNPDKTMIIGCLYLDSNTFIDFTLKPSKVILFSKITFKKRLKGHYHEKWFEIISLNDRFGPN
jgi:hypothetical protein